VTTIEAQTFAERPRTWSWLLAVTPIKSAPCEANSPSVGSNRIFDLLDREFAHSAFLAIFSKELVEDGMVVNHKRSPPQKNS
jgi:hypothetical protein